MNLIIKNRCAWCLGNQLYLDYHDKEWGKLVKDDKKLFEFLVLESAQAGLSFFTILKKRETYREAFLNYDIEKIAKFNTNDIEKLLNNNGIVRNKLKIKATINNAKVFINIQNKFGSFYNYVLTFFDNKNFPIINNWEKLADVPSNNELSDKISADLRKKGIKFFGTTICYAYLQAMGFINDHLISCDYKY